MLEMTERLQTQSQINFGKEEEEGEDFELCQEFEPPKVSTN
jgi:hypothetical protein